MTSHIKVIHPGLHTTVQDPGRRGFQDAGVPVSGPLDRIGLRVANALVGNAAGTPALELMMQGPACEVRADSVRIALAGCNGEIEINGASGGGRRIVAAGRSVRLVRGDTFRIGSLGESACAYLAIESGIAVDAVLGSASTYVRGAFGGWHGRALAPGDEIALHAASVPDRAERMLAHPCDAGLSSAIRVVLGPQADYFDDIAIQEFLAGEYCVSLQSDRMGFRLEGPAIAHARGHDIVSDGIVTGAIQVPGVGQPIVLMADAQTTGGYPKIATVISADIPLLARRKPGSTVRFAAVSLEEAQALRRTQEAEIAAMVEGIREVAAVAAINVAALARANLTAGVVRVR
ncbi:5-oxoprolinase subunit C [Cupriavidus yeoncheonensis]|uniref:5-oxoprolinase subunit C n=1 Tax=Cupriavidus yeoncheonensis TaxID=1462994 RepID=A0A916IZB6_9BURK|nr:biotin-dependent carboxyltransferase family protein [Cupriavidus yeoncheonensis]CAG2157678.1 5-oxoprolinase subunit C [Cupriavidus yeoncheonensis]